MVMFIAVAVVGEFCGQDFQLHHPQQRRLRTDMTTAGKTLPGTAVFTDSSRPSILQSQSENADIKPKSFKIKMPKDSSSMAGSDNEGSVISAKNGTSKASKTSKKRKLDDSTGAKKAPSKSTKTVDKKDKIKKKVETKPKGPVDVERQCGVPLPQGGLCARSLTCKSHSMGSKRAVTGRSQPYDILLAQYQKKNQAKLSMSMVVLCHY